MISTSATQFIHCCTSYCMTLKVLFYNYNIYKSTGSSYCRIKQAKNDCERREAIPLCLNEVTLEVLLKKDKHLDLIRETKRSEDFNSCTVEPLLSNGHLSTTARNCRPDRAPIHTLYSYCNLLQWSSLYNGQLILSQIEARCREVQLLIVTCQFLNVSDSNY